MCRICGYVTRSKLDEHLLEVMTERLVHGGPDDGGVYYDQSELGFIGLGHRRLSILDLSAEGHQPMISSDQAFVVVYNGEIYNFKDIRKEIEMAVPSSKFHSNCDTEVLLKGYQLWGEDIIEKCNGMFAFAIYDKRKNQLFMGRDRMGQKPLYYFYDGVNFGFASELKALRVIPEFRTEINQNVLPNFLYKGYICGEETIYKNIYRLNPGHVMIYNTTGVHIKRYWDIPTGNKLNLSETEIKEKLEKILLDSVAKRMVADVPVGTFLSGGVDSSLITALVQHLADQKVNTYTISFDNKKFDESDYAEMVAKHLNTNHHVMNVSQTEFDDLVDSIPIYYDEPFADASQIPTMLVSKFARQDVTVVLTGDAGDELFGGYDSHQGIADFQKYLPFIRLLSPLIRIHGVQKIVPEKVARAVNIYNNMGENCIELWNFNKAELAEELLKGIAPTPNKVCQELFEKDLVERRMHLDSITYLPDDILVKVDRASMKYGLEARCPLLDYRIVEFAFKLPNQYKYAKGIRKKILKEILYKYVPETIFQRPKMGFGIPYEDYLQSSKQQNRLRQYSDPAYLNKQGFFDVNAVQKIISRYQDGSVLKDAERSLLWRYFIFQLWYEQNT